MTSRESAPCIVAEAIGPGIDAQIQADGNNPAVRQLEQVKERMLDTYGPDSECAGVICLQFERCANLGELVVDSLNKLSPQSETTVFIQD